MKLRDAELKAILAEVESEISTLLKSEAKTLKKAVDGEPAEESPGEEAAPPEAPDGDMPPEASASAPTEEAGSPEASASPEVSAAPEASAPGADPAAVQGPVDPEALKAEYAALDPETLKMHYMAAKAALFEAMGAAGGGMPPEAGAPGGMPPEASAGAMPPPGAGAMPPPGGPDEMMPPPAMKNEMKPVAANGALKDGKAAVPDDVKGLGKSEKDARIADLEQQVELLAKGMDLVLGAPMRKAVTHVSHVAKTEEKAPEKEPSKTEIREKIRNAVGSGRLTKSQKEALFSYGMGNTPYLDIKDLLS